MQYGGYSYGGYPAPGGYYPPPPVPDQLATLRQQQQFQQPMMAQNMGMMQGGQQMQQVQPQAAQQTMQQPMVQPMQQAPQPTISGPYYVSGDAGARGYLVAANTTVLLFDADPDANTFWLKSADSAGMPSMRTFDYTERINGPKTNVGTEQTHSVEYVTVEQFNLLAARADALAQELEDLKTKRPASKKSVKEEETDG